MVSKDEICFYWLLTTAYWPLLFVFQILGQVQKLGFLTVFEFPVLALIERMFEIREMVRAESSRFVGVKAKVLKRRARKSRPLRLGTLIA